LKYQCTYNYSCLNGSTEPSGTTKLIQKAATKKEPSKRNGSSRLKYILDSTKQQDVQNVCGNVVLQHFQIKPEPTRVGQSA